MSYRVTKFFCECGATKKKWKKTLTMGIFRLNRYLFHGPMDSVDRIDFLDKKSHLSQFVIYMTNELEVTRTIAPLHFIELM